MIGISNSNHLGAQFTFEGGVKDAVAAASFATAIAAAPLASLTLASASISAASFATGVEGALGPGLPPLLLLTVGGDASSAASVLPAAAPAPATGFGYVAL